MAELNAKILMTGECL